MHKYLRAIGFSEIKNKRDEEALLLRMETAGGLLSQSVEKNGETETELRIPVADGTGLILRGSTQDGGFRREFYIPYLTGELVATGRPCEVDKSMAYESYSCMCDEARLGISLIFHLTNALQYDPGCQISGCRLAALSVKGKILLPLQKTERQAKMARVNSKRRFELVEAARQGDEAAMESLTLQDMNLCVNVTRKLTREKTDLYSLLESLFMPVGVECDEYTILGTIQDVKKRENEWTGEQLYHLTVECNDIRFVLGINERDLMGVPEVGRRFKGDIWMQGEIDLLESGV